MWPLGILKKSNAYIPPTLTRVLEMHFDGANNGTVFTDSTGRHTIGRVGSVITTTTVKFEGTASGQFPNDTYLAPSADTDFFMPGDMDLIVYVRPINSVGNFEIIQVPGNNGVDPAQAGFNLKFEGSLFLKLDLQDYQGPNTGIYATTNAATLNVFNKVRFQRVNGVATMTLNDNVGGSVSVGVTTPFGFSAAGSELFIGDAGRFNNNNTYTGQIDMLTLDVEL